MSYTLLSFFLQDCECLYFLALFVWMSLIFILDLHQHLVSVAGGRCLSDQTIQKPRRLTLVSFLEPCQ